MSFHVHTEALRTAASRLQALAADVPAAQEYTRSYLHVDRLHSGIFQNVVAVNDDTRTAVLGALARIHEVLDGSHRELRAVARDYDRTDADVRAEMDRKHREVEVAPGDSYASRHSTPVDTVPEEPEDYEPPAGIPDDEPEPVPGGGGGSW